MDVILATKKKMSQAWTEDGRRVPVTIVQAGPVVVTQIKSQEKDGYLAVQVGFGEKKIKNITKPILGHLRGAVKEKVAPRFLREMRIAEGKELKVGDLIKASDVLEPGDLVKVTGISKGKGFAGVVKRWGFAGGPRTHGQSDRERAPGSIGATTTPGRVLKGKKMAGRMGGAKLTVSGLTVLSVSPGGEVKLSGPVPGNRGGLLFLEKTGKVKKFSPLVSTGEEIHPQELPPLEIKKQEENSEYKTSEDAKQI